MLAIILKILSIIGIVLLILLGILLLLLLLILFFPISYRLYGCKIGENINVRIKIKWLFGLLRMNYAYPEPGKPRVKLLFFNLFDGSASQKEKKDKKSAEPGKPSGETPPKQKEVTRTEETEKETASPDLTIGTQEEVKSTPKKSIKQLILEKYEKIKYTIKKIYDKIKHIWENIQFYKELLLKEDTKALFSHALRRLGNILKKLKPKKLMADVLFGTGEPDTTGYVLGVYGILSPHIKKPSYINLTPDFEQAVFEGRIEAYGHIRIFSILSNGVMLLLDKRLHALYGKIKKHSAASKLHKQ